MDKIVTGPGQQQQRPVMLTINVQLGNGLDCAGLCTVHGVTGEGFVSKAFINIGGFMLPGVAGYLDFSLLWVAAWSFAFSLVTASKSFRAFAGLQAPPDTSSARYSMIVVRWVFCLVPMLVAYAIGWGIARLI